MKYQGKDVQILRDANKGDADYDEDVKDQVVIRTADGQEKTVPRAEVTEDTTVSPTPPQKPV